MCTLEQELKETKDYYLRRIDALEKGNTTTMSAGNANDFSDTTLLVAGESIIGGGKQGGRHTAANSKEDTIHLMTNPDDG